MKDGIIIPHRVGSHTKTSSTQPLEPTMQIKKSLLIISTIFCASAQAGEIYGGVGLPGVFLGYAHGLTSDVSVRADYATLGQRTKNSSEDGIDYKGKLKIGRLGVFADYFPLGNGFRLTGGLTFNQIKFNLNANPNAGTVQSIGDTNVTLSSNDYFNVTVKFPTVTPFLGVGYGHKPQSGTGLGFHADLGASIGRAKLSVDTNLVSKGLVTQADVDKELADLRGGVGKVRFVPQISFGVSYAF
ncbi:hypothetical protein [uncultured Aquabacterium sp.]|uniref:hypothetical protein n=1 Tax=uncultured Aquabacterium sp. TaxID=158753 RepID=UPI0030D54C73